MAEERAPTRDEWLARLAAGESVRGELLARIAPAFARLMDIVEHADEAALVPAPAGAWSARDHLHHLASWERKVAAQATSEPIPPALGISNVVWNGGEIDAINAAVQALGRATPGRTVIAALREAHARTVATIEGLAEEALLEPGYPDEPGSAMLLYFFAGNTFLHYAEHLPEIEGLLKAPA
ncbi:MAG: DinB family protein [Dehalococcoidia bacterium]